MEKLYLVDAYALIYKFYYAFKNNPMRNEKGMNTSAVFGFVRFVNDLIEKRRPNYLGVAFDPPGGTFRNELYPAYKANRESTPEDIIAATPYIKAYLDAMRIPVLEVAGYEADDVIGTLAAQAGCNGFEVYMVTPDKDYGQLIRDCVYMYKPGKKGGEADIIGKPQLKEIYGLSDPQHIIDMLALWGDASDNVPGIPGIGEKSAVKLINELGTVEEILAQPDRLKGKQKENILNNREQLLLAKKLVTIDTQVPLAFEPDKLRLEAPDETAVRALYRELGFQSLLKERGQSEKPHAAPKTPGLFDFEEETVAPPLFSTSKEPSLFDPVDETAPNDIGNTPHKYTILREPDSVREAAEELARCPEFCFDTETTSLNPISGALVGLSLSVKAHTAWYIPLFPKDRAKTRETLEPLVPLFADPRIAKIGQNVKFDIRMLAQYGIEVNGTLFDTMVMHYLLNSDERHGMDYLSEKYLNYAPVPIEALIGKGAGQKNMADIDTETVAEYAGEDADVTFQLKHVLYKQLQEAGLCELYHTVEEPLIRVLADMEETGVTLDTEELKTYERELNEELEKLNEQVKELAGTESLNVNSSKQIGEILFEKLKIEAKPKRTKTKQYRTDEEYLVSLKDKHPIIGLILEYRGVKKLLSTYVEALPALIEPGTGRIHTTYNQCVASTGRLSSSNPNLQNIPIRDKRGKRIRAAFIASDDDHLLLSADYSQIELRLMADLSGDPALIEAFLQGEDIHTATAAKIFKKSLQEVTPEERRAAKTANFGIIYGISAFGLAGRLDIPRSDARSLIDGYFESYPQVKAYMERTIASAREKGYVETVMHRRKSLPDIHSSNQTVRGYAERNAINAPIQGSAADLIKIAMSKVHNELKNAGCRARMILQVHDELVIELPKEELEQVRQLVINAMETVFQLKVPLIAECGYGRNWLEAH